MWLAKGHHVTKGSLASEWNRQNRQFVLRFCGNPSLLSVAWMLSYPHLNFPLSTPSFLGHSQIGSLVFTRGEHYIYLVTSRKPPDRSKLYRLLKNTYSYFQWLLAHDCTILHGRVWQFCQSRFCFVSGALARSLSSSDALNRKTLYVRPRQCYWPRNLPGAHSLES